MVGRTTYTERKQIAADKLNDKYGDFSADDLPESIGKFDLSYKDEDGVYCAKVDEQYVYSNGDDEELHICMGEHSMSFEVCTRVKVGRGMSKDEVLGTAGYLGKAVEMAQERFEQ